MSSPSLGTVTRVSASTRGRVRISAPLRHKIPIAALSDERHLLLKPGGGGLHWSNTDAKDFQTKDVQLIWW